MPKTEQSIGLAAASAVVNTAERKQDIIDALLARPVKVIASAGKPQPRTVGWAAQAKPHPQGGTRQLVASVRFFLDDGEHVAISARVSREVWIENGNECDEYVVTMGGLDYDALRDQAAKEIIRRLKERAMNAYIEHQSKLTAEQRAVESKRSSAEMRFKLPAPQMA